MRYRHFILIIFILFIPFRLFPEDYIQEFTDLKDGDSVKPLTETDFDLRLYIFLDMNSCFVCKEMIPELDLLLNQPDLNLEKVIFFSGVKKETAEDYVAEKGWKFNLVIDYNNIYTDFYKIKKIPVYIITDNKGKILNVDKLGGVKTTRKKIDTILEYARSNRVERIDPRIMSSDTVYTEDFKKIYTSHVRNLIYLEKANEYFFNSDADKFIHRIDNKGKVIETIYLDDILATIDKDAFNLIDFAYDEETQDLTMNMNTGDVVQHIMFYNTKTKKLKLARIGDIRVDGVLMKSGLDIEYSSLNGLVYLNLDFGGFSEKAKTEKEPQLLIYKVNDSIAEISDIIEYKPLVRDKNDIWAFSYSLPLVIGNRLLTTNMYSTEVFEFDLDGKYKKKYGIYNSKYYRYNPKPMVSKERDEYSYFRGRASINEELLYDKTTDKIYVYFQNRGKVDEENLKLGPRTPTKHYLVEVSDDENSKCIEFELPKNHVPFYIDNGIVHTTTNDDGIVIHRVKL